MFTFLQTRECRSSGRPECLLFPSGKEEGCGVGENYETTAEQGWNVSGKRK